MIRTDTAPHEQITIDVDSVQQKCYHLLAMFICFHKIQKLYHIIMRIFEFGTTSCSSYNIISYQILYINPLQIS